MITNNLLPEEYKKILLELGYEENDLPQIHETMENAKYSKYGSGRFDETRCEITKEEALSLLGEEKFLSGVGRAAFHWDASRTFDANARGSYPYDAIDIDASHLHKKWIRDAKNMQQKDSHSNADTKEDCIIVKEVPPEFTEAPMWWFDDSDFIVGGNRQFKGRIPHDYKEALEGEYLYDADRIVSRLEKKTGKSWEYRTIRGCCQSDWNYIYYKPSECALEAVELFEKVYFNLGQEWACEYEEGDIIHVYTTEWQEKKIKERIADSLGVAPSKLKVMKFTGWHRTAEYSEM